MKKLIDLTTMAVLTTGLAGIVFHFNVGGKLTGLIKDVVHQIVPWMDLAAHA